MFDLSKSNPLDLAEAGYEFAVELPSGETTDFRIKVRGAMSKPVRDFQRKQYEEYQMKEKVALKRKQPVEDESLEDMEERAVKNAVTRVISWSGLSDNDVEVQFSKEAALKLFKEHFWIRQQVIDNSDDVTNFRPE
jgi:hypothetical protein